MVRAILENRKSQTRRIVKPQPNQHGYWPTGNVTCDDCGDAYGYRARKCKCGCELMKRQEAHISKLLYNCPKGGVGDHLWVRETFAAPWGKDYKFPDGRSGIFYRADDETKRPDDGAWKPSIHMPRWASRITLEISGVRVEQLGQLSEDDAISEGVNSIGEFINLWESINNKWEPLKWIWVLQFRKV
jgi:hypothetical protein